MGILKNLVILVLLTGLFSCSHIDVKSGGLPLTQVTSSIYSAIGATDAPSRENRGHNNNLSIILTDDGVVVVNGGDNYQLAAELHISIQQLTSLPVLWVVNENGQGHAFLGNCYWREQGVPIIAHVDAVHEIQERGQQSLKSMQERNGEELAAGTCIAVPEHTFERRHQLPLKSRTIELLTFGDAHSPGDISVWIPDEKVLIAGDIAFHERIPGVFPDTHVKKWIASFDRMMELPVETIIPGHGHPTGWDDIVFTTRDYLQYLVDQAELLLDEDGGLADAYNIDQSRYAHLNTFEELAAKNAGRVFQQIEMEFFE